MKGTPCDCLPGQCKAPTGVGRYCRRGVSVQIHVHPPRPSASPFPPIDDPRWRNVPIATRPQDWAEPARTIIFGPQKVRS